MALPLLAVLARVALSEIVKQVVPKMLAKQAVKGVSRAVVNKTLRASVIKKSGKEMSTKAIKSIIKRSRNPVKIAKWQTALQYKMQSKKINQLIKKGRLVVNIAKNPAKYLTMKAIKQLGKNSVFKKGINSYKTLKKLKSTRTLLTRYINKIEKQQHQQEEKMQRAYHENWQKPRTYGQQVYFSNNVVIGKNSGALIVETKKGKYVISQNDDSYDTYLENAIENTYETGNFDDIGYAEDDDIN